MGSKVRCKSLRNYMVWWPYPLLTCGDVGDIEGHDLFEGGSSSSSSSSEELSSVRSITSTFLLLLWDLCSTAGRHWEPATRQSHQSAHWQQTETLGGTVDWWCVLSTKHWVISVNYFHQHPNIVIVRKINNRVSIIDNLYNQTMPANFNETKSTTNQRPVSSTGTVKKSNQI